MNTFDAIITFILLFGFVKGFMKGLFIEVTSLIALIAGIYGTIHFSYFLENYIKEHTNFDEKYISLIGFAGTFIIILVVISLTGKLLTKMADEVSLGLLNKILGGIFGVLKFGCILSFAFYLFEKANEIIPFVEKDTLNKSILYGYLNKVSTAIYNYITS